MIKCDKCSNRAIIFQKYSGMHLCRDHFDQDVNRKVRETLRQTKIFGRGAKIAIALSGDKDSSVLLYILKNLFAKRRDIEIIAILIDEGLSGYRPETLEGSKNLADRLEVPYIVRSFKDAFGVTADQIASQNRPQTPCMFCRVMRRALLNRTALDIRASVLATGQNLDDEAQTIMISYLRGDTDQLFRLQTKRLNVGLISRIKPLMRVPQRETALYAISHGLCLPDSGSCPYLGDLMSREVKKALNDFEQRHPGTKYSLLRSMERIVDLQPEMRIMEEAVKAKPLSGGED
jgi:uncharacterized protein (TIGR00269 family)